MQFSDFMLQITRPYWSPVHPHKYILHDSGKAFGWGIVYPDDIGSFNLMWLVSGVGQPPDDYKRYSRLAVWVLGHGNDKVGGFRLRDAAALMSLRRFDALLSAHPKQTQDLQHIKDALRLKV